MSSPEAVFNVIKIGKKGTKAPRQLTVSKEGLRCSSSGGVTWTQPNGTIVSITPDDPEGKMFTVTTVTQRKFEASDPGVFKHLRDAARQTGIGASSLESAVHHLGLSSSVLLKPQLDPSRSGKVVSSRPRTDGSKHVSLADFELLHVVGKGSFGKVFQVRKYTDGKIYALKILKKIELYNKRQIEHTLTERKILATISHPFMPRLHYAFQTDTKLYMAIDYANGGEIFYHLRRAGRFPEVLAVFYCAEIVSSIHHLHKKSIIYRDLKPENVLLDSEGHVKITDFGLAKIGITSVGGESDGNKTMTLCGTPEYLAPEILQGIAHGKAVDWWSTGIMFYEMLVGVPPFYSQNRQEMFHNTIHNPVSIPDYVSPDARNFLVRILAKRPEERLGSGPTEGMEVKEHPVFRAIDWDALERRQVPPPYKPKSKDGIMDISNIDKLFLSEPLVDTPAPPLPPSIADAVNKQFANFEFNKDLLRSAASTSSLSSSSSSSSSSSTAPSSASPTPSSAPSPSAVSPSAGAAAASSVISSAAVPSSASSSSSSSSSQSAKLIHSSSEKRPMSSVSSASTTSQGSAIPSSGTASVRKIVRPAPSSATSRTAASGALPSSASGVTPKSSITPRS